MLTPAEFAQPWEQDANRLVRFPAKSVERLSLSAADKWFLIHAGLPDSAAPYLCFVKRRRGQKCPLSRNDGACPRRFKSTGRLASTDREVQLRSTRLIRVKSFVLTTSDPLRESS